MPPRIQLHNKPIVITGGGTGIGAATAIRCATAGMPVILAGRRMQPLMSIAEKITAAGGRACFQTIDVTEPTHAADLLDHAESTFGPPWAVFANAGRGLDRPAHATSDQEIRDIFEVNFFATQSLLREASTRMLDRGQGGHLLACASCVSKFSPPYHAAYSATKAAQDLYCQSMRLERSPAGIHVSTVHPVTTITDFFETAAETSGRTSGRSGIDHTPRWLQQSPDRVARGIVRCLQRPTPEVWTSRLVRSVAAIRMIWPRLMDRSMRQMLEDDRLNER